MFQSKTVFIVGAGASNEVELPTGKGLTRNIADKLNLSWDQDRGGWLSGDRCIAQALSQHVGERDPRVEPLKSYLATSRHISGAMPLANSIDDFIDGHPDNERIQLCGKLGIVQSILEAENQSLLYFDPNKSGHKIDYTKLYNAWYCSFFQLLVQQCPKDQIKHRFEKVSFIIFNYDRCIEHFLFHALRNYYSGMTHDEAARLVLDLEIFHPYGMVGYLPWQDGSEPIPFGSTDHGPKLLSLSSQIKTFSERVEDKDELMKMRQLVQDAEIVVFLGFAFHPSNMKLIKPTQDSNIKQVFPTTLGISDSDVDRVKHEIVKCLRPQGGHDPVRFKRNLKCRSLFTEYWRSLSIS
jgi:hypothetical protein